MKLSILVPVYNEEKTIGNVIDMLYDMPLPGWRREIIVVNDASTDTTRTILARKKKSKRSLQLYHHTVNKGKGAAIRTAIAHANSDYCIIQDADLEYDPRQIKSLLTNVSSKNDVVYGTRLDRLPNVFKEERRVRFFIHYVGNRFLSFVTSILYGQWITDMETCYKLIPTHVLKHMTIRARGFEFEPEITAKLIKSGYRIREVSITTTPRGYEDGKKLHTIRDGIKALYALLYYRFMS